MSLAGYEFQLQQIKASLALDPENEKLKALASKIQDLINLNTKSLEEAPKSEANVPVKVIDFFAGEKCEVKEEADGHWQPALIQSISSDKLSCTVIFPDGKAQHCTKSQIRRPVVQRKDSSEPAKTSEELVVIEKDTSKSSAKPLKRKHTRQEHEQKKEAEQKEKQVQWQKFSSKISKHKTFREINLSDKNRLKDSD
jgi:hypothetical protein